MSAVGEAATSMVENMPRRLFWVFMAFSTPLFGLICYNSGLGGDPLEYFTIGRAYAEGQPFFSFIHGKSFGMYAFVAWMMMLGVEFNHLDDVQKDADDSGAIKTAGTTFNSVVRNNLIHDVNAGFFNDNVGFWFDNMSLGWVAKDNIFYNLEQGEWRCKNS